ncbi:methylenetetrahydrofolate reductase [Pseudomonadota bacterium]
MNPSLHKDRLLAGMVDQAYLEVIPTSTILERLRHLPRHSYVAITCSPAHGVEPTLRLVEQLRALPEERRLKLIPHIAARMVRDRGHLREILARLDALQVESIFVPGGDSPQPAGDYDCALDLLRDMAEIGHAIEDVGIAAHPEGHPLVGDAELLRLLRDKQPLATYLVTQMCFDADVLIAWLLRVREAGVTLPAWIGLPGVADIPKLISLSLRIGVGQSVKVLKKQKGLVSRMLSARPYQPDDLLAGIQRHLGNPGLDVPGFHLFSFNDVERTERWRQATLSKINGGFTQ